MKASFNTVLSSEDDFTVCKFDTFLDLIFTPNKDRLNDAIYIAISSV